MAKGNVPQELQSPALRSGDASQSASGEELGMLLPSVLDRAFKGEL
jgi:hypothetical protein